MVCYASWTQAPAVSLQDTFDRVVSKLIPQGKKALNNPFFGTCSFDDGDGNRCAIGWLLPEDQETSIILRDLEPTKGLQWAKRLGHNEEICRDLMGVHDKRPVAHWPTEFARIAGKHNLKLDVLYATMEGRAAYKVPPVAAHKAVHVVAAVANWEIEFKKILSYDEVAWLKDAMHAPHLAVPWTPKSEQDLLDLPAKAMFYDWPPTIIKAPKTLLPLLALSA